ncbi:MAG: phosphoglucosamine mutase [Gemmatimonadales bacterium]|nr:phosphoglucosamine mutase [Gemmatimonadales bacterium]NIN09798.1 phosphoglucosamine mutase [Gemmatimonadales bacterium]NIN48780.1 phosphoglucosamine mutase [Gemmatimonadales bacterium]NIP06244.1 phosphoglucosamine mutase [Gemmatimonadales bacterium]NIR02665.1 phosphoglucosamine mutase [Gemmatimonadales bacterium]
MSGLIRSISGVRGIVDTDLTAEVVARYAAAFGRIAPEGGGETVVLARDSRTSGPMFAAAARGALQSVGIDVIDCGLIATPTAQLAVEHHQAAGGIIISASHNPVEWNALKFVGPDGLFLDWASANRLFELVDTGSTAGMGGKGLGTLTTDADAVRRHVEGVLGLPFVDLDAIRARGFTVALDCVRGAGGTILPELLERLGCRVVGIDLETDGCFTRSPEPVPANLSRLQELVRNEAADVGMAVDPDVDRLALVAEGGEAIGEDYTLAFAVRAVLDRRLGPVAVNLSTSQVVEDVAAEFGVEVTRAPVGEANVARAMVRVRAVIGGEGNGGVMLPDLHLGRDAPVAAALVLDLLARTGKTVGGLTAAQRRYVIVKAKAPRAADLEQAYQALEERFGDAAPDRQDGLRLSWSDQWLHIRPSGTEPIVRLIAEAPDAAAADRLIAAGRAILERE